MQYTGRYSQDLYIISVISKEGGPIKNFNFKKLLFSLFIGNFNIF